MSQIRRSPERKRFFVAESPARCDNHGRQPAKHGRSYRTCCSEKKSEYYMVMRDGGGAVVEAWGRIKNASINCLHMIEQVDAHGSEKNEPKENMGTGTMSTLS